jgi:hypothetical protein
LNHLPEKKERLEAQSDNQEAFFIRIFNNLKGESDTTGLEQVFEHLKSTNFRERLIADYLNVLADHKELLELRKLKITKNIPEAEETFEQEHKKFKSETFNFKLKELILEESPIREQMHESNKMIQSINKYINILTEKLRVANQVLELVENI